MFAILLHLVRLCLARFETENISSRILGIKNFIWCNMQYLEIKKTGEKFYYRTVLSPTEACNGNGWHYNSHRPDWHGWHLAATVVTLRYIKKNNKSQFYHFNSCMSRWPVSVLQVSPGSLAVHYHPSQLSLHLKYCF